MRSGKQPIQDTRNVRNRKGRSPGYEPGNHWVICDRCGCAVRESDSKVTWEGYVVCPDDWESRHPQDFVRSKEDRMTPEGNVRPDDGVNVSYINDQYFKAFIAGLGVAGAVRAGSTGNGFPIPTGTFNPNTL